MTDLTVIDLPARRTRPAARFAIRPDTSDAKAIAEVFDKNAYRRQSIGFGPRPGQAWVDLGANVGAFAVLAAGLGATVLRAVEAEETNANLSRQNLDLNGLDVPVCHAAVVPDDHQGDVVALNVNLEPLSLRRHSILKARRKSVAVNVPAMRWSEAIAGADGAKVNIEGAEIPVFALACQQGAFGDLRQLVFEWSFDVEPRIPVLAEVVAGLERHFETVGMLRVWVDCGHSESPERSALLPSPKIRLEPRHYCTFHCCPPRR